MRKYLTYLGWFCVGLAVLIAMSETKDGWPAVLEWRTFVSAVSLTACGVIILVARNWFYPNQVTPAVRGFVPQPALRLLGLPADADVVRPYDWATDDPD